MVDKEFQFFGVDNNEFKLDDVVYEAVEDPDDGYRSCLGSVEVSKSEGLFWKLPLGTVKIVAEGFHCGFEGWSFVDTQDGHVWLRVGTDHSDDYYPCFVFDYQPKKNS